MQSRQNYDVSPDVTDTNGRALAGLPFRSNWEAPIAFSPFDATRVLRRERALRRRATAAARGRAISPDLTRNDPAKQQVAGGPINTDVSGAEFYDTIFDIAPSPLERERIWVGTDDGFVQLTTPTAAGSLAATSRRATSRRGGASTRSRPRAPTRDARTSRSIAT